MYGERHQADYHKVERDLQRQYVIARPLLFYLHCSILLSRFRGMNRSDPASPTCAGPELAGNEFQI